MAASVCRLANVTCHAAQSSVNGPRVIPQVGEVKLRRSSREVRQKSRRELLISCRQSHVILIYRIICAIVGSREVRPVMCAQY